LTIETAAMKTLQIHADYMMYEPLRREGSVYEEVDPSVREFRDIVVLFTCVEEDDDEDIVSSLARQVAASLERLGVENLLIYPYAHLSNRLAPPQRALHLLKLLEDESLKLGLKVHRAPFGWNKKFTLSIKGHPLAEQFRSVTRESLQVTAAKAPTEATLHQVEAEGRETLHVQLGRELDLFSINPALGSGFPLFHDKGWIIREELITLVRESNKAMGFKEVWTPHVFKSDIWYKTGHYEHYRDRMFTLVAKGEEYVVKPMNCPAHAMIFASRPRSYRDLPIMLSEFGTVYRNEQPGELTGLLRVRSITQDDGHVFARPDQVEGIIIMILRESLKILNTTIRGNIYATLSTRPEKFIGDPQVWEKATEALRGALERAGLSYEIKAGEGAFYGPKIDIDVEDSLGRRWQCTTVQLDFFLPERLGLEYVDSDGSKKRPIMIHRAILGSIERFIGILLEHYNWRLPFWLSPVQVAVLPVSTRNLKYAEQAKNRLEAEGIRTELMAEGTLEKRVRSAHQSRASFMMIVGDEEERSGTCSLRDYRGHTARGLSLEKVVVWLKNLYKERVKNVGEIDESLSRLTQ